MTEENWAKGLFRTRYDICIFQYSPAFPYQIDWGGGGVLQWKLNLSVFRNFETPAKRGMENTATNRINQVWFAQKKNLKDTKFTTI